MAASIVILSLISPITRISQSSLNAFFTPSWYVKQSLPLPTSFWIIKEFFDVCIYSIGLSSVNIFLFCVSLICAINALNVVDLPEFVLPVTNINPCGWYVILLTTSGTPNASNGGNSFFIILIVNTGISFAYEAFTLRRIPSHTYDVSNFLVSSYILALSTFPFIMKSLISNISSSFNLSTSS